MNYRLVKKEDFEQVKELCSKYRIEIPYENDMLFVADDCGQIVGICGLKKVWQIEPMISTNPLVANTLFNMVKATLLTRDVESAICFVKDVENVKTFVHAGVEVTDTDMVVMRLQLKEE